MTDRKLNNIARASAFALLVLFFILVAIGAAFGQEDGSTKGAQPCDHKSNSFERFDALRVLPASVVLNIEPVEGGQRLEVKTDAKYVTKYSSFTLTRDTAFDAKAVKKGKWVWVVYSICDAHVYAVTPVLPGQFK